MKSFTRAAGIALAAAIATVPALAQLQNNSEKQLTCNNNGNNGDRARHCEIREQTLPGGGRVTVDATPNGGITVKGSLRGDVLVRARIEASGDTEAAAANTVSRVNISASGSMVKALGPETDGNDGWSVSYEIFVPQNSDLELKSVNGGLTISDVRGSIHFETQNGGVHLRRVAGDVTGATQNGGVNVDLAGAMWEGRQLDVKTQNGGVTLSMPSAYSAHVQAETVMGRISSDFTMPQPADGNTRQLRHADFNVGSGGPLIHVATQNGGVRVKKADAQ